MVPPKNKKQLFPLEIWTQECLILVLFYVVPIYIVSQIYP